MKLQVMFFAVAACISLCAQDIKLPAPARKGGKPLMECLTGRCARRDFTGKQLTDQQISNLLYAACGVNRVKEDKLTIPTARNWQDLTVYAALPKGVYRYDSRKNMLVLVKAGDFRSKFGKNAKMFGSASMVLIYVSNYDKLKCPNQSKIMYSGAHTGFAIQNVGLCCVSEGLGNVVVAMFNYEEIEKTIDLGKNQFIILAQLVGTLR